MQQVRERNMLKKEKIEKGKEESSTKEFWSIIGDFNVLSKKKFGSIFDQGQGELPHL